MNRPQHPDRPQQWQPADRRDRSGYGYQQPPPPAHGYQQPPPPAHGYQHPPPPRNGRQPYPPPQQGGDWPPQQGGYQQPYPPTPYRGDQHPPPGDGQAPKRQRFSALAWTALILGIVGVVGSPIIILNNLTAVVAAVGVILGVIALFGTRKILAGVGVGVCIAAITFTVLAQGAAVAAFDEALGGGPDAAADASVSGCEVVDDGFGLVTLQGVVDITNSTDASQSYAVTVSVDDDDGARLGEINAFSNSLAAGQSVTLAGMEASGIAPEGTEAGPVECTVASVNRFPG